MFYAVSAGRHPGIYATWDECKAQVNGFPGAKYKKFSTKEEALAFIQVSSPQQSSSPSIVKVDTHPTPHGYELWTDGSAKLNINAGYGWVFVGPTDEWIGYGAGKIIAAPYTNSHGEIVAIIEGLRTVGPVPHLTIKSDSEFVVNTINVWGPTRSMKDWASKAYGDVLYALYVYIRTMGYTIMHVRAHSGIKWNEFADVLAKAGANS